MDFRALQKWAYRTRPHETESRVIIGLVDGDTCHVSLDGLAMCTPHGQPARSVGHLPVHRDALASSLVTLEGDAPTPPGFEEGITTWRDAKGGVFTIVLREIVETVEWGMNAPTDVLDHLVREMRARQLEEMIEDVIRAVRRQPALFFLSHPQNPSAPLYWQFDGRSPCVVVFTDAARARAFAEQNGLTRSELISPPSAHEAFGFLSQLHANESIEWASVNAGHECNVPFYLDAS